MRRGGAADGRGPAPPRAGGLGIAAIYTNDARVGSRVVTAFQFYFDESGIETRAKYLVIAWVAAEAKAWSELVGRWRRVLASSPSIEYFKQTEAVNLRKQFAKGNGWTKERAEEKAEKLTQIVGKYAAFYSLVRCHKAQYEADKL